MLRRGLIPTTIKPAVAWSMIGVFFLMVTGVPLLQICYELAADKRPQVLDLVDISLRKSSLHGWEENLEKASVAKGMFQPWLQGLICSVGGFGNTNAVVGREGWMFYRPGLEYLGGPGILDPTRLDQRQRQMIAAGEQHPNPDSRPAILCFHQQCQALGIHLIVMPLPDKAMLQPAKVSRRFEGTAETAPLNNPDFSSWISALRREGVDVFDCTPAVIKPTDRRFLIQDTHWTPEWMESVAGELAKHIREKVGSVAARSSPLVLEDCQVERLGDLADMLRLSERQRLFPPQRVTVHRVVDKSGNAWQPKPSADILFLGDSFSNIYSLESMGWGDSAGFVEHLSYALRRDVDRITRNDAGAFATRQMLSTDLARGKDRLAGKKVVVWEFAVRELTSGDWKILDFKKGTPPPRQFVALVAGSERVVTGIVAAAAPAPHPGKVPYRDHIIAVHLTDLEDERGPTPGGEALVYMWSMRNNVLTHAAGYRPDQKVELKLRPWSDVSNKLDAVNRQELDDEELNLQEPCWGEEVHR